MKLQGLRVTMLVLIGVLFLSVSFVCAETAEEYSLRTGNTYVIKEGQLSQVTADYSEGIETAEEYVRRAIANGEQGNITQVIADCTKAIEINPHYAPAYNYRGLAYASQGNFKQSISESTKAIEIDPNYAVVYNNRGLDYYMIKEYDKAWADVHKAQVLGYAVDPVFLNALKKVTGRDK